ncbi:MAG TPA: T9SS type A sorting domain-containing protein, partial [Bacteroidetes bacterium]|nr:T9SS type A sorting domain-containing protein [Bacteroidota bacterium]
SAMNELLGNFTFTSLEGIKFSVGVDSASNHLDPSSYAASHPLAPKSPSMHWGWSAGYRFVAMEGKGGSSLNQAFEIHALEDKNYFETTVMTSGSVTGQGITINIDADYAMAIRNIDVGAGVFNHGGNGEAKTLLENFRDYVFSPAGTSVGISQEVDATANKLVISPNPVSTTQTFTVSGNFPKGTTLSITDLTGRIVLKSVSTTDRYSLNIDAPGYYLVVARRQGKVLATGKLLIAQ